MATTHRLDRLTLRWLLLLAVAVGGGFLAGVVLPRALGLAMTALDPPPIRSSGVVSVDRSRADAGYVTVGALQDDTMRLISHGGDVVHSWNLPYPLAGMATMASNGSLVYLGQLPEWTTNPSGQPGIGGIAGVVQRLSWDGQVLWTFEDKYISHDFTELPDGTIATLKMAALPTEFATRVPGGIPNSEQNDTMWEDEIVEIDPTTKAEQVVFDPARVWEPEDHPLPDFMPRSEWTHANSITYTESDPITHQEAYLVSFRDLNTIVLVARETGQVIWSYGGLWVLDQQHDATLLPNGHVLLFDNGQYLRGRPSASTIIEIDPATDKVVWSYGGYGPAGTKFYSALTGGAQRLANGNTLITLGLSGQLIEITPDASIVWDYRSADGRPDPKYPGEVLNFLFKSRSYDPSVVGPLLEHG